MKGPEVVITDSKVILKLLKIAMFAYGAIMLTVGSMGALFK